MPQWVVCEPGNSQYILHPPFISLTTHNSPTNLVWFITGTSQGFGNELVRAGLQHGDSVVATSRQPKKVAAAFKEGSDRLLAIPWTFATSCHDRRRRGSRQRFGRVDVLVNNAGHGLLGAVEEASDEEIAAVYEIKSSAYCA